jgi:hypothetical protein
LAFLAGGRGGGEDEAFRLLFGNDNRRLSFTLDQLCKLVAQIDGLLVGVDCFLGTRWSLSHQLGHVDHCALASHHWELHAFHLANVGKVGILNWRLADNERLKLLLLLLPLLFLLVVLEGNGAEVETDLIGQHVFLFTLLMGGGREGRGRLSRIVPSDGDDPPEDGVSSVGVHLGIVGADLILAGDSIVELQPERRGLRRLFR